MPHAGAVLRRVAPAGGRRDHDYRFAQSAEFNGIKMQLGRVAIFGEMIQRIRNLIDAPTSSARCIHRPSGTRSSIRMSRGCRLT